MKLKFSASLKHDACTVRSLHNRLANQPKRRKLCSCDALLNNLATFKSTYKRKAKISEKNDIPTNIISARGEHEINYISES